MRRLDRPDLSWEASACRGHARNVRLVRPALQQRPRDRVHHPPSCLVSHDCRRGSRAARQQRRSRSGRRVAVGGNDVRQAQAQ